MKFQNLKRIPKLYKMGNYIRTLRQKDSFYGDYVTGFHVVHRTIERSFERIENIISKDTQATFALQNRGFRRYVSLCIQFLSLHHKQEDKFIFVATPTLWQDLQEPFRFCCWTNRDRLYNRLAYFVWLNANVPFPYT